MKLSGKLKIISVSVDLPPGRTDIYDQEFYPEPTVTFVFSEGNRKITVEVFEDKSVFNKVIEAKELVSAKAEIEYFEI